MIIYGIPAANLLLTGIGAVKVARWARRATLISASIWVGLIVALAAWPVWHSFRGMPYEAWLALGVLFAGLAFAIGLIVAYTRASVRATFERGHTS